MAPSKALAKYASVFPDVLERPEELLGPNYRTLFNYWAFLDSLTIEQIVDIHPKNCASYTYDTLVFDSFTCVAGRDQVINLSNYTGCIKTAMATYEIIGMHVLLDQGLNLHYLRLKNL
jgi:hypothetical protein